LGGQVVSVIPLVCVVAGKAMEPPDPDLDLQLAEYDELARQMEQEFPEDSVLRRRLRFEDSPRTEDSNLASTGSRKRPILGDGGSQQRPTQGQIGSEPSVTDSKRARRTEPAAAAAAFLDSIPSEGAFISVTSFEGRRRYIRLLDDESVGIREASFSAYSSDYGPSIARLEAELAREAREALIVENFMAPGEESTAIGETSGPSKLWADKYCARSFTELLTEERLNRQVLRWLRSWHTRPTAHAQARTAAAAAAAEADAQESGARVLLLVGPPGAGKTTLAHVAARQAGFRPVEVNASDDRSASAFMRRVIPLLENEAVDPAARPACLIVDEIDGSLGSEGEGAVDALLRIINYEPAARRADESAKGAHGETPAQGEAESKKRARPRQQGDEVGPSRRLARPIICICNDAYVPALRRLREIALVLHVEKPESARLVARLRDICRQEGVQLESRVLLTLVEIAENDLRTCLNTLQFIYVRQLHHQQQQQTEAQILQTHLKALAGGQLGQKDVQLGLFQIWRSVFQLRPKQHGQQQALLASMLQKNDRQLAQLLAQQHQSEDYLQPRGFLDTLFDLLISHGELERVLEGCHFNFLCAHRLHDPILERLQICYGWLVFADLLRSRQHIDHQLSQFLAAAVLAFHKICASPELPQLQYPRLEQELRLRQSEVQAICAHLISRSTHTRLSTAQIIMELAWPLSLIISSPMLRSVAVSALSQSEHSLLAHIVNIMADYNLKFIYHDSAWYLQPPLAKIASFASIPESRASSSSSSGLLPNSSLTDIHKEIIAHELELRQFIQQKNIVSSSSSLNPSSPYQVAPIRSISTSTQYSSLITQQTRNFFGQVSNTYSSDSLSLNLSPAVKAQIMFKFHEGYTNAVRRSAYVKDFV
jgi:chromosome transmission fidelity protein 18